LIGARLLSAASPGISQTINGTYHFPPALAAHIPGARPHGRPCKTNESPSARLSDGQIDFPQDIITSAHSRQMKTPWMTDFAKASLLVRRPEEAILRIISTLQRRIKSTHMTKNSHLHALISHSPILPQPET
jgi:hypothetical protein